MTTYDASVPELVGTAVLDTIGLVIANVAEPLALELGLKEKECGSLGLISSRTGAAGQLLAVDDAVKATNTKIISIELPRDTKGWGGHGNYIVIGAHSVSDARRAVEIALEKIEEYAGEVHISDAGHLEFAYCASAGEVLEQAFGIPRGGAFGFMAGSPAAIWMVMADRAVKFSQIQVTKYMTPSKGTSHSNEVIIAFTGETSAVREAVLTGKRIGFSLLSAMGSAPLSPGKQPYLL